MVNKWLLANGVERRDRNDVKNVGGFKAGSAQKGFALALEKYQERMKHKKDDRLSVERLKRLNENYDDESDAASDKEYRNTGLKKADDSIIPLKKEYQGKIAEIRESKGEHPEAYKKNKKIIDRIFKELLQTSVELTQKEHDYDVQKRRLKKYRSALFYRQYYKHENGIDEDDVYTTTKTWLNKYREKEVTTLEQRRNQQLAILETLLKGEATGDISIDVQLHDQYGFATEAYKDASAKIAQAKKMKKEGIPPERIRDLLFHWQKQDEAMKAFRTYRTIHSDEQGDVTEDAVTGKRSKLILDVSNVQNAITVKKIFSNTEDMDDFKKRHHSANMFEEMAGEGICEDNELNERLYINLSTKYGKELNGIPVQKFLVNLDELERGKWQGYDGKFEKFLQEEKVLLEEEHKRILEYLNPFIEELEKNPISYNVPAENLYKMLETLMSVREQADVLNRRSQMFYMAFQKFNMGKIAAATLSAAFDLESVCKLTDRIKELYNWKTAENRAGSFEKKSGFFTIRKEQSTDDNDTTTTRINYVEGQGSEWTIML